MPFGLAANYYEQPNCILTTIRLGMTEMLEFSSMGMEQLADKEAHSAVRGGQCGPLALLIFTTGKIIILTLGQRSTKQVQ